MDIDKEGIPQDRRTSYLADMDKRILALEYKTEALEKASGKSELHFERIMERLGEMKIVEERLLKQGEEVRKAFSDIAQAREIAEKTQAEFREYVARIEGMKKVAWFAWSVMGSAVAGCAAVIAWMLQYGEVLK